MGDLLRHRLDRLVDVCQHHEVATRHQRLPEGASDAGGTSCHHRYNLHGYPCGYGGTVALAINRSKHESAPVR